MKLFHKLKRFYQRIIIKSRRNMTKDERILRSTFELDIIKLIRKLTSSEDVELFACPDTGRRFIDSPRLDIKVILEPNKIIISNHSYLEFNICLNSYEKMKRIFDGKIRIRRNYFQQNVIHNVDKKLQNLINQLN
jgi:hypothetical protein